MKSLLLLVLFNTGFVFGQLQKLEYISDFASHEIKFNRKEFSYKIELHERTKAIQLYTGTYTKKGRKYYLNFKVDQAHIIADSTLNHESRSDSVTLFFKSNDPKTITYVVMDTSILACYDKITISKEFDSIKIQHGNYVCQLLQEDVQSKSNVQIRLFNDLIYRTDLHFMLIVKAGRAFKVEQSLRWKEGKLVEEHDYFLKY
jgi:hypothetical protein